MSLVSIKQIIEGSVVSFRSKNASDPTIYQGTLESIGTYRSIRSHRDPRSYNEAVRQSDPLVPSDITALTYFLITVDNASEKELMVAFADEWIAPGSLNQVSLGSQITVLIEDPKNNPQSILSLLASAGYGAKIIG
jgi:hypothetical protein